MRSYLTNLTRSVSNFIDWQLASSKAEHWAPEGASLKPNEMPKAFADSRRPNTLRATPFKICPLLSGKSETENTCWQCHVSGSLHTRWLYRSGKRFLSCAVLFWFLIYVDSVRLVHLEEVWEWGGEWKTYSNTCRERGKSLKNKVRLETE